MGTTRAVTLVALICAGIAMSVARLDEPLRAAPARRLSVPGTLPLAFERLVPGAYTARSRGYDVKISREDVIVALAGGEALAPARVRVSFPDAAPGVLVPEARLDARRAAANTRRQWITRLPAYGRVRLSAIQPGIDIVFYGHDRQLEHDLHIAPGARADRFAMAFEGIDSIGLDASGDLVVSAAGRFLGLRRPAGYQEVNGARTPVAVEYVVEDHVARLVLGEYDRTIPLHIHPTP